MANIRPSNLVLAACFLALLRGRLSRSCRRLQPRLARLGGFYALVRREGHGSALAFLVLTAEVLWTALFLLALGLTILEAQTRTTTPDTFYLARFYPASVMMLAAASGSWRRALIFGGGVGLLAGVIAPDHGAWFTYIAPNVVQSLVMAWLCATWLPKVRGLNEELAARVFARLMVATLMSVIIGASLGVSSLIATELYYRGVISSDPILLIVLHWLAGDLSMTAPLWLAFYVLNVTPRDWGLPQQSQG